MTITKEFLRRERYQALLSLVLYFGSYPFLYSGPFILYFTSFFIVLILQGGVPSIAALLEFLILWNTQETKNLRSRASLLILLLCIFILIISNPEYFWSIYLWILIWAFSISWLTGRSIVRQVFIVIHRKELKAGQTSEPKDKRDSKYYQGIW